MSATVTATPVSPASAYRPLSFTVTRSDPAGSQVAYIRPATTSDVSALGNGLVEGDILVRHATIIGPTPSAIGQTVNIYEGCDDYNGVWTITNEFTVAGLDYMVIDAPDYGAITPLSGYLRIWLDNYAIHCRVNVYTDVSADPEFVDLGPMPVDSTGAVSFDIGPAIRRFFLNNIDIDPFCIAVPGTVITQDAHNFTANFYRYHIAETYDVPGVTDPVDPFDGDHTVSESAAHSVAVNAVHPYHETHTNVAATSGTVDLTWSTTTLNEYRAGSNGCRFLTYAPRRQFLGDNDRFRIHILTLADGGGEFTSDYLLKADEIDELGGVGTNILSKAVALAGESAALSIAIGPADLSPYMSVPARYRVYLTDAGNTFRSEVFQVFVDNSCSEVRRPMYCMNKLGGVDAYPFKGREVLTSNIKRYTKRKPMGNGSGFDWERRMYRTDIQRVRRLSTRQIKGKTRQWLVETFMESANVTCVIDDTLVTPVIITSESAEAYTTEGGLRSLAMEYALGVDNMAQEA